MCKQMKGPEQSQKQHTQMGDWVGHGGVVLWRSCKTVFGFWCLFFFWTTEIQNSKFTKHKAVSILASPVPHPWTSNPPHLKQPLLIPYFLLGRFSCLNKYICMFPILYSWRHTTHTSTLAFPRVSVVFPCELIPCHGHKTLSHRMSTPHVCVVMLFPNSVLWQQHFKVNFRQVLHGEEKPQCYQRKLKSF